jgi:hypothetical protein
VLQVLTQQRLCLLLVSHLLHAALLLLSPGVLHWHPPNLRRLLLAYLGLLRVQSLLQHLRAPLGQPKRWHQA